MGGHTLYGKVGRGLGMGGHTVYGKVLGWVDTLYMGR